MNSGPCSEPGVLDKVLATSLLDDGINESVEFDEDVDLVLYPLKSSGVVVEVCGLAEEFSAETLVRINVDSVLVTVTGC